MVGVVDIDVVIDARRRRGVAATTIFPWRGFYGCYAPTIPNAPRRRAAMGAVSRCIVLREA